MSRLSWLPELLRWLVLGLVCGGFILLLPRPDPPVARASVDTIAAYQRAQPSVVSIRTRRVMAIRPQVPDDPALRRFFGTTPSQPERESVEGGVGSGVILSDDGYLLTNHHVVAGYDEVWATVSDGRVARATLVGSDADTDLAVLKIDLDGLAAIRLAATDSLQVGAMVLAIGNPFGIGQSVSLGVISALDRSLNSGAQFIQTDAAINNGSSGGALVNLNGELVGINALVLNRRLGEGIGFAIPADIALDVYRQLRDQGFVTRGWFGANYGDAVMLDGSSGREVLAVRVMGLYVGAPAQAAGLQPGDILMQFGETVVLSSDQLARLEASTVPGTSVTIQALRAGLPFTMQMTLIQRPEVQVR